MRATTDRDWDDDSEYQEAVQRAERMTKFGWMAIAGVTGLLGIAVVAVVVAVAVVLVGWVVVVVWGNAH